MNIFLDLYGWRWCCGMQGVQQPLLPPHPPPPPHLTRRRYNVTACRAWMVSEPYGFVGIQTYGKCIRHQHTSSVFPCPFHHPYFAPCRFDVTACPTKVVPGL